MHQSWQFPRNKFSLIRINPAPGAMCLPVSPAQLSLTFSGIAQETKLYSYNFSWKPSIQGTCKIVMGGSNQTWDINKILKIRGKEGHKQSKAP